MIFDNKKKFDIFKKICYNIIKTITAKKFLLNNNALGAVCRRFESYILPQYGGISSGGRATIYLHCLVFIFPFSSVGRAAGC